MKFCLYILYIIFLKSSNIRIFKSIKFILLNSKKSQLIETGFCEIAANSTNNANTFFSQHLNTVRSNSKFFLLSGLIEKINRFREANRILPSW